MSVHRYRFVPSVSFESVTASLLLATWGAESLHGDAAGLAGVYSVDSQARTCEIRVDGAAGHDLSRLFAGYLERQFGDDAFQIERLDQAGLASAGRLRNSTLERN